MKRDAETFLTKRRAMKRLKRRLRETSAWAERGARAAGVQPGSEKDPSRRPQPRRPRQPSAQVLQVADRSLERLALECSAQAQTIREPTLVRQDAEESLQAFIKGIRFGFKWSEHGEAYKLLKARWRDLLPSDTQITRDKNILDWTVRLLMDRLLAWSVVDRMRMCDSRCRTCRKCERAVVFPYRRKKTDAARAAQTALTRARIRPYGARLWTVGAILKIYQRHVSRHYARKVGRA